jgi:hypothetical protein
MKVRPGAVVRGAGVAVACLLPAASKRPPVLLGSYAGAWFLDKPGLRIFVVIPDTVEPWKRTMVPFTTSAASWSTVMLTVAAALRRTRVPTPIAAVLLGGGVVVVDSILADLGEARDAREAAAAQGDAPPGPTSAPTP